MTINKNARLAGLSYLLIIIFGIISHLVIRGSIFIKGDLIKTTNLIIEDEKLFRLSIVSDMIMIIAFLTLGIFLYQIFHKSFKTSALILLALNIVGVAIMGLNMLNQLAALEVLNMDILNLSLDTKQSLSYFYMHLHSLGYQLAAISYGLWLLPMGYLIIKSNYFPRIIGLLLMLGAIGYLSSFLGMLLNISIPDFLTLPADLGELAFCLYLLIKGTK